MTTYRQIFIDIDSGNTLNGIGGGILINKQKFNYGTEIPIEFVFCSNGEAIDISDIKSARVSIDNDYTDSTEPMTRSEASDIDLSEATNGIVRATIKTGTEKFKQVVDGNSSSRAYLEFRGYDEKGQNTRCYIISIDCLGYIDPDGGDTIPIPETSATKEFVEAKLSGATEEFNTQIANLSSSITTNTEGIAANTEAIATLSSNLSNSNTELDTANESISNLSTTITGLTEQVNSLSTLTNYELPIATADTLGGIKIGSGLTITEDGTLNADIQSTGDGTTTITTNAEWGKISGTLSAQTDLQTELKTLNSAISANLSAISANSSNLTEHANNTDIHITAEERTNWNAKSTFSGNYNDLTNSPDLTIYATKDELTSINENLGTLSTTVNTLTGNTSGETTSELPIILASERLEGIGNPVSSYTVKLKEEDIGKLLYNDDNNDMEFDRSGAMGSATNKMGISMTCEADNFYILLPQTLTEYHDAVSSTTYTYGDYDYSSTTFTTTLDGVSYNFSFYKYITPPSSISSIIDKIPTFYDATNARYLAPSYTMSYYGWSILSSAPLDATTSQPGTLYTNKEHNIIVMTTGDYAQKTLRNPSALDMSGTWMKVSTLGTLSGIVFEGGPNYPNETGLFDQIKFTINGNEYTLKSYNQTFSWTEYNQDNSTGETTSETKSANYYAWTGDDCSITRGYHQYGDNTGGLGLKAYYLKFKAGDTTYYKKSAESSGLISGWIKNEISILSGNGWTTDEYFGYTTGGSESISATVAPNSRYYCTTKTEITSPAYTTTKKVSKPYKLNTTAPTDLV